MIPLTQNPEDWAQIAELLRPQGRRGELLASPLTDLDNIFTDGLEVWLARAEAPSAAAESVRLESHWFPTGRNAGRIVLKLSNANSISEAEALEGLRVCIPTSAMPALDADTYFVRDLIGCTLFNQDAPVGEIVDVQFAVGPDGRTRLEDAAPILVVERASATADAIEEESSEILIPFISAWTSSVDTAGKRVHMTLPEGLVDPAEL